MLKPIKRWCLGEFNSEIKIKEISRNIPIQQCLPTWNEEQLKVWVESISCPIITQYSPLCEKKKVKSAWKSGALQIELRVRTSEWIVRPVVWSRGQLRNGRSEKMA